VRFLVAQGVEQFLDLGSGIPTAGNLPTVARAAILRGNRWAVMDRLVRCYGATTNRPSCGPRAQVAAYLADRERLVEPVTRGDPESPLRWTWKSLRRPAGELAQQGHGVSHQTVAAFLHSMEYSVQGNGMTREGDGHPNRDAQLAPINATAAVYRAAGNPVSNTAPLTTRGTTPSPLAQPPRELFPDHARAAGMRRSKKCRPVDTGDRGDVGYWSARLV
jgi:hypothetical protein